MEKILEIIGSVETFFKFLLNICLVLLSLSVMYFLLNILAAIFF